MQQVHPDLGLGPTLIFDQLGLTDWPLVQDLGFRRQLSILLAFPKWHSLISNDDGWPSTDQVLQHLQLRQLIMSQNTAPISALQDPQLTITEAGFLLLDDPWMTDVLKYRCTICHAMIFQPSLMLKHLQAHNMYQYDTHCNLQFLMDCAGDPCYFCHLAHPAACKDQCVPALNVALHISYVSRRRDELYLVQPFDTGSIGNIGQSGQGSESSIHAAQQKAAACSHSSGDQDTGPAHEESHHLGPASRGHAECHDVRAPTGPPHESGSRQHCAGDAEGQSGMASRGHKRSASETPPGMHHDESLTRSPCGLEPGPTHGRLVQGLHQVQLGGFQWRDALPTLGPEDSEASTNKRPRPSCEGSYEEPGQHPSPTPRAGDHGAISCSEKARQGLGAGQIHSMVVDGECAAQSRDLARTPAHVLSCHLATHSDTNSPTISSQIISGQDIGGEPEEMKGLLPDKIIRILVNTTGAMCYVNCFMQGLAWQTLQSTSLDEDSWKTSFGFLLIMALTLFTPEPLNLRINQFFLDALSRGWSLTALDHQHDMIEFADFMMNALKPCFVDDRWGTLPFLRGSSQLGDTHLWAEKGGTHTSIRLPVHEMTGPVCTLDMLISQWHDDLGLCRILYQAGVAVCLALERTADSHTPKNNIQIDIPDCVWMPCFLASNEGITWIEYRVVAAAIHFGQMITDGHYRCAVKQKHTWFLYDDGKIPEQMHTLTASHRQNLVYVWLVRQPASAPDVLTSSSTDALQP